MIMKLLARYRALVSIGAAHLLLLASVGCRSNQDFQKTLVATLAAADELGTVSNAFYRTYHRWPKSREELVNFAAKSNTKFSNERYTVLRFQERSDGWLVVDYEIAAPSFGKQQTV